jgi:hypothetical protein
MSVTAARSAPARLTVTVPFAILIAGAVASPFDVRSLLLAGAGVLGWSQLDGL